MDKLNLNEFAIAENFAIRKKNYSACPEFSLIFRVQKFFAKGIVPIGKHY
jgi:hypothetical protein